jgi:hypothetical protein
MSRDGGDGDDAAGAAALRKPMAAAEPPSACGGAVKTCIVFPAFKKCGPPLGPHSKWRLYDTAREP